MNGFFARNARHIAWLGSMTLVAACGSEGGSSSPTDPLPAALEAAVDETIIPAMESFAAEATSLESEAASFCADPTAEGLSTLQDQWLQMTEVWNEAAVYFFGPLDEDPITPSMSFIESMRPRGTVYTNTVREEITAALDSDEPLDDAYFSGLTFNRVGIVALEVLVFEDTPRTGSTAPADVLEGYESNPRKCDYLEGMAGLLSDRADLVETGWTIDYQDTGLPYREQVLSGMLEDGFLSVPALVRAAARHVEYLRDRKLDGSLDAQIAGAVRPDPTPFWENLAAGIDSIEAMLDPPGSDASFFAVMDERGFEEFVTIVRDDIEAARTAVDAEDRTAASDAFVELEASIRREVVLGLGIDLGIGFSDGD